MAKDVEQIRVTIYVGLFRKETDYQIQRIVN